MRVNSLFNAGGAFVLSIGGAQAISPGILDFSPDGVSAAGETDVTVPDGAEYRPQLLDPVHWHPKNANFEIIDWEKWEACEPAIPFQFDPPQQNSPLIGEIFDSHPNGGYMQWGRVGTQPDEVVAAGRRPNLGTVTDPDLGLFKGIISPHPDSSLIPEPFRNKVLWTYANFINEYIVAFNRGAWRTNTPEGRSIGLVDNTDDWSMAPNSFGLYLSGVATVNSFLNFQVSPDGKWFKVFLLASNDPNDPEASGPYIDFYVVQEDDVFTDKDGNVLDWVKPGDMYRIEWGDTYDPYECKEVTYTYFPRVVATLDEETGEVATVPRNYNDLVTAVTAEVPAEIVAQTNNFTTSENMTTPEKFWLLTDYEPDRQMYVSAPEPPYGAIIEDIGVSTASPVTTPTTDAPVATPITDAPVATPTTDAPAAAPVFPKSSKSKAVKSKAVKSAKGKGKKANKRNTGV